MNGRDIINLQEAYLQVYSEPEISEEAQIAAEYFYEQGLDEEDVENLIEELGVDEFSELVNEILESYELTEARRSGRIEPVTTTGKSVGQLRGGAKTSAITRLRKEKAARRASETSASDGPSGMKAALRSQAATAAASKPKSRPSEPPAQTKAKMGGLIGGALSWAKEKGTKDIEQTKKGLQTLGRTWQNISDTKPAQYLRVAAKQASREAPGVGRAIGGAAGRVAASIPAVRSTYRAGQRLGKAMRAEDFELWVDSLIEEEYNVIVSHLLDEGYAESLETAENILLHMSEDWAYEILDEARVSYSAKKARAGKDIGKPGRQFAKIAASAAKRYGSKERGEKVAGAVLAKLRKGH